MCLRTVASGRRQTTERVKELSVQERTSNGMKSLWCDLEADCAANTRAVWKLGFVYSISRISASSQHLFSAARPCLPSAIEIFIPSKALYFKQCSNRRITARRGFPSKPDSVLPYLLKMHFQASLLYIFFACRSTLFDKTILCLFCMSDSSI